MIENNKFGIKAFGGVIRFDSKPGAFFICISRKGNLLLNRIE